MRTRKATHSQPLAVAHPLRARRAAPPKETDMGTTDKPWGDTPIRDQTQEEFEAHHRENQARANREAAEKATNGGNGGN